MIEFVSTLSIIGLMFFCCRLALELYHEGRRAWFFKRTRKHIEQEWKAYYERTREQRQQAQEDRWPKV